MCGGPGKMLYSNTTSSFASEYVGKISSQCFCRLDKDNELCALNQRIDGPRNISYSISSPLYLCQILILTSVSISFIISITIILKQRLQHIVA
jgi:hypothetical protein